MVSRLNCQSLVCLAFLSFFLFLWTFSGIAFLFQCLSSSFFPVWFGFPLLLSVLLLLLYSCHCLITTLCLVFMKMLFLWIYPGCVQFKNRLFFTSVWFLKKNPPVFPSRLCYEVVATAAHAVEPAMTVWVIKQWTGPNHTAKDWLLSMARISVKHRPLLSSSFFGSPSHGIRHFRHETRVRFDLVKSPEVTLCGWQGYEPSINK